MALRHHAAGRSREAERQYRRALAVDPNGVEVLNAFARFLMEAGELEEALAVLAHSLSIRETEPAKAMFVGCLRRARRVADTPVLRTLLARAMGEPWARPAEVAVAAFNLLKSGTLIHECVTRVSAAWPRRLSQRELLGAARSAALSQNALLRVALESAPVCDAELERVFTTLRSGILDAATTASSEGPLDADTLAVGCALARQCFINEYAFALADGEIERARRVRDAVEAALRSGEPVPPAAVTAAAAYFPLHSLEGAEALLSRPWPGPISALLAQQVREPLEEAALRTSIPRLTPVADPVSRAVQRQYEESPYPRWLAVRAAATPVSIDAYLGGHFPEAPYRPLGAGRPLDYLMAGCGTGQTTVETARFFSGLRILAVDLSLASLAYARRKSVELGHADIEFAQADILELGLLGRAFDVINCSGVLHHLADPMTGWKALASLLRPSGVMRVAVYSEAARRGMAARAFVAARGYRPTPDNIRRCRGDILDLPDDDPVKIEARNTDFFTMSGCRDWLFHVHERPLRLAEIARFLAENALQFLGFNLSPRVAARYAESFPHDRAQADLDSWGRFEQEHPAIFRGMYQLWVQKR